MLNDIAPRTRIPIPRVKPPEEARNPLSGYVTKQLLEKAGRINASNGGTQKLPADTSTWMGRTWSKASSYMTFDNFMEVSIVAGVALGAMIAVQGGDPMAISDGIFIAASATAANCMIWGLGCAVKGEYTKAAKRLVIGAAFATAAYHDRNSMIEEALQKAEYKLAYCEEDLAFSQKTITSLSQDLKNHVKTDLYTQCRDELKTLQTKIEKLSSRTFWDIITNKPTEPSSQVKPGAKTELGRHIVFGTTYVDGNPIRDQLSQLVDETHREYVRNWDTPSHPTWNIEHQVITKSLLKQRCDRSISDSTKVDCVPYWNKIAVIRNWLKEEKTFGEEWRIVADDDMPVTNMKVDPSQAIDLLRRGKDSSVIIARDVQVWTGDPKTAVNTGLLFVRKDAASKKLFDAIWERRNSFGTGHISCRTLGTCQNQDTLHEQQAMASVLSEDRGLLDRVVTVVMPRDRYQNKEIAINTFERSGCFIRSQAGWGTAPFSYDADASYPDGAWREGDWMGQTAGVPINGWYCEDKYNGKPAGPLREDKLRDMIAKTIR